MNVYDPGRASSGGGVIDKEIEKFYNTYKCLIFFLFLIIC